MFPIEMKHIGTIDSFGTVQVLGYSGRLPTPGWDQLRMIRRMIMFGMRAERRRQRRSKELTWVDWKVPCRPRNKPPPKRYLIEGASAVKPRA